MVCSYRSYCLYLPVELVDCQMEICSSILHHVYQGGYVAMHDIDIDGEEQKICHDCVDELWMGGNIDKANKTGHSTVYRTDKSEEGK